MLSYIEISKSNLIHNYHVFRSYLAPTTQLVSVVKANAYGHGDSAVVQAIGDLTDYIAVDDLQELERIREQTDKPIITLGYIAKDELPEAVRMEAIMGMYDMERLKLLDEIGAKYHTRPTVHIKIDAGLGRQGVLLEDLEHFIKDLAGLKHIEVGGIYTHFSNIDEIGDLSHTKKQEAMYSQACDIFNKHGYEKLLTHISSTGGILVREKNCTDKLARLGIGLYGMWPSQEMREKYEPMGIALRPVMRWVTKVAQVKTVPAGYPIGYGLSHITKEKTQVAVIPQGYSDGYDRGLSGKGEVLIHGARCQVLGKVAMNMFVVDVTHLDVVKCEDEVVLLGSQNNEIITAEEIARKIDTVNYEITTRISPYLPRVLV